MWDQYMLYYHMELDELRMGLNNLQGQTNHYSKVRNQHEYEACACCKMFYKGTTSLWEYVVCPKVEFDEWHKKECLYGDCVTCGVEKLFFYLEELNGVDDRLVKWRCYAIEETRSRNGKTLKKLTLVYKKMSSYEFFEYLKPKLQHFVKHNCVTRWQDKHFKTCVKSLSKDSIVSIVDFVENYNFQVQNEV